MAKAMVKDQAQRTKAKAKAMGKSERAQAKGKGKGQRREGPVQGPIFNGTNFHYFSTYATTLNTSLSAKMQFASANFKIGNSKRLPAKQQKSPKTFIAFEHILPFPNVIFELPCATSH
jgi:hypothetical protein